MKMLKAILLGLFLCLPAFVQAAKITEYPAATTPLAGTEVMPCEQSGTKKCTTASIAALATKTTVGLGSVTNDAQTKAAVVPNTPPAAGGLLVGNAGGTAYAPVSMSGDCTLASTGSVTCSSSGGGLPAALTENTAIDAAGYELDLTSEAGAYAPNFSLMRYADDDFYPSVTLYKTRGTKETPTTVQVGKTLGVYAFGGQGSQAYLEQSTSISSKVTGFGPGEGYGQILADLCFNTTDATWNYTDRMCIDPSGVVSIKNSIIVGDGAATDKFAGTGYYQANNSGSAALSLSSATSNAYATPDIYFARSRGTAATPLPVQNGDVLLDIWSEAEDGSTYGLNPFYFECDVVGAVSSGSVPTDCAWYMGGSVGGYVEALRLHDNGVMQFPVTNTAGGTTGAQTINKTSFTVNLAAGQSSLDVTNDRVTADSIVLCSIKTDDATAILKNVVTTTGHAVIKTSAAVTAETRVGCVVFNN